MFLLGNFLLLFHIIPNHREKTRNSTHSRRWSSTQHINTKLQTTRDCVAQKQKWRSSMFSFLTGPSVTPLQIAHWRNIKTILRCRKSSPCFKVKALLTNGLSLCLISLSLAKCQKLSLGKGVSVSPSHCLSSNQNYGSTCTFACARGYRLSGPSSTQCGKGGIWSRQVNTVSCNGLWSFLLILKAK